MVALATGRLTQRSSSASTTSTSSASSTPPPTPSPSAPAPPSPIIRRHPAVSSDLPLLAQAASWTGSIANQNRGTLGGNIVNASPAADSSPALLAYDATVTLVSAERPAHHIPYRDFHLALQENRPPPRRAPPLASRSTVTGPVTNSYIRKVGTRNAQAISKVALAALAPPRRRPASQDIRIGAASLAERPIRCYRRRTSSPQPAPHHRTPSPPPAPPSLTEARPIDDIRSTAQYRAAVAANLLEEFLRQIAAEAL